MNFSDRVLRELRARSENLSEAVEYGLLARLWRVLVPHRPPGIDRLHRGRNTLHRPWLTSVFGLLLLATLPVVFGPARHAGVGWLRLPIADWLTRPMWLYPRGTQGLHVELGLVLISVVLAKLWSLIPRLFAWPRLRSLGQVLERVCIAMRVGGIVSEVATGVLYTRFNHVYGFSFHPAIYYGARVLISAFRMRVVVKVPRMISALRSTSRREVLRGNRATRAQPPDSDELLAANRVTLRSGRIHDRNALRALRVNVADLPLDHGYLAQFIESRPR